MAAQASRAVRSTMPRGGCRTQRLGFYTIGSAGHESNAYVALALEPSDPALLHYRSGGFYLARAAQAGRDGVEDVLLGMAAAAEEPIAGGRHKVFGHRELAVIPQTSTIASHLPRAVGMAFAIERARRLGVECGVARRRGRRLLVRRRVAEPRDGAGCAQHDVASSRTTASRFRCCSSARTTASGSACRRPRRGSSSRSTAGRSSPSSGSTVTTPPRCSRPRASWGSGCGSTGTQRCCISAPCATSATRARTWRPRTGRARRSGPTTRATRCSRRAAGSCRRAVGAGEELAEEYLAIRARVRERALAATERPQLAQRAGRRAARSRRARRPPSPRSSASGGRRRQGSA